MGFLVFLCLLLLIGIEIDLYDLKKEIRKENKNGRYNDKN